MEHFRATVADSSESVVREVRKVPSLRDAARVSIIDPADISPILVDVSSICSSYVGSRYIRASARERGDVLRLKVESVETRNDDIRISLRYADDDLASAEVDDRCRVDEMPSEVFREQIRAHVLAE